MEHQHPYRLGPFVVDPARRLLLRHGDPVHLHRKAYETLLVLVRNSGRVVEKEELLKQVWADRVVEENNLSQSISTLRKALGDTTAPYEYIVTVAGVGYRLAVPVTEIAEPAIQSGVRVGPPTPKPARTRRSYLVWGAMAAILFAIFALGGFRREWRVAAAVFRTDKNTVKARPSLAILGFENLSGHNEDDWISTGLAQMLGTELAAGDHVRVISQEDVAQARTELAFRDAGSLAKATALKMHRTLGSDLLVSGCYAKLEDHNGKQIRLDVYLQDANTGETLSEIAEIGQESELFDLVSQAGVRLRQKLGIAELSPTETLAVKQTLPADPDAARFYAQGLANLRGFDAMGARDLLQKAIVLEPEFALAHSALAEAWSVLGFDNNASQEATAAFKFSTQLPRREQLVVEGRYRMSTKNWNEAVGLYQTLFGLFPDDVEYGLLLASAQISSAHPRDALATVSLLRRLPSPAGTDPRLALKEYEAWKYLGDFEHMETALSQASDQAQQNGALLLVARARTRLCWVRRILAKPQAIDDCQQARQIYAAAGDRRGEAETLRFMGDVHAESDVTAAIDDYNHALALEREIGHIGGVAAVSNQLATQYAKLGEHATAEKTYESTLAAFREQGDTLNATGMQVNIGAELAALGQIDHAREAYGKALAGASALGNKYIEGLAEYNLALLEQSRGDLEAARNSFQQSLAWFRDVKDREWDISALRGLGEVAMSQGDLAGAQSFYQQALSTQQASEYQDAAAQTQIDVALLSMEQGTCSADAEASLRQVFERFQSGRSMNDHAFSSAVLARCLQLNHQMDAALEMAGNADALSARSEPPIRLAVRTMVARVRAAEARKGQVQALDELRSVVTEARKLRFVGAELDARLAIAEIEIHSGNPARGRDTLQTVEKDAARSGYVLIARKAQ